MMFSMRQVSIPNAIIGLLSQHPVSVVHVAGALHAPPPLSHVVSFPRLEIPFRGRYENDVELGGLIQSMVIRPGEALFIPPNCWNRPTWRRPVQVLSLLFGARQMGLSLVTAGGRGVADVTAIKIPIPHPYCRPARNILDALLELVHQGGPAPAYPDLVMAILRCVRDILDRPLPRNSRRADRLMEQVCVHLQEHYQYDISRDGVAKLFGIAPNHLSRLFRTHGHMSFNQYLNYVRTDRAKLLLKTYPMKLDDIARQCGYRDTPYFCRAFRRITRQTPGAYRQVHASEPS